MSRRDLVSELLNEARTSNDKLHMLHQIREIVLHREQSLINEVVPEALEFMQERAVGIRKFLVVFSGEAFEKSTTILPSILNLFNHLVTDTNEIVVTHVTRELKKAYDKMVMNIVNIPLKTKQSAQQADPKQMWQHLRTVTTRLIDVISSEKGESMRDACLALAESLVVFGLPAPPVSHDPRLKRTAVKDSGSSGLSIEDVPLHHAFINRNELEQEAEDIFKKMLLWTTRGGPQGHPFTPSQMSILGQGIARIASQRPRKASSSADEEGRGHLAAKALIFMLTGKSNACKDMKGSQREALAKATHGLLRSPFSSMADPDSLVSKLRSALTILEGLGFEDVAEAPQSKKRPISALDAEGDDEVVEKKRRDDALVALDAAEQAFKAKISHGDESAALGGIISGGASAAILLKDTELAGDLSVPFEAAAASRVVLTNVTQKSAATGNSEVIMKLVPQSLQVSNELATAALQRLLDSFYDTKCFSDKALASHAKLTVRMAVSMALVDVAHRRSMVKIPLILSLPANCSPHLITGVPMDVSLPQGLWLLISFVLSPPKAEESFVGPANNKQPMALVAAVRERLVMIMCLLDDLKDRADEEQPDTGSDEDPMTARPCSTLYEGVCIVVLVRFLQNLNLRELATGLVTTLTWVPRPCLSLLKLLMHTGTKATVETVKRVPGRKETRNRGTRMEALTLLTHLVFAPDEEAGAAALNHLLWCSISEEFETRSKAVTLLLNDVLPGGDWVSDVICNFACQAAGTLVGQEAALQGAPDAERIRKQKWELPSDIKAAAEKAAAEKAAAVAAGAMDVDTPEDGPTGDTVIAADEAAAVAAENDKEEEEDKNSLTLSRVMAAYDHGAEFGGIFPQIPTATKEMYAASVKRSVQLLMQLCTSNASLLSVVMDLAGAAARHLCPGKDLDELSENAPDVQHQKQQDAVDVAAVSSNESKHDGEAPAVESTASANDIAIFGPKQQYNVLLDVLKGELTNIIPAILQFHPTDVVFGHLARCDPMARPLLEHALGVLHCDMHMPPTPRLMETVHTFMQLNGIIEEPARALRFTVSLLGGMAAGEVKDLLPRIISSFITDSEALTTAFSRIVLSRPPALTKASLLVALHRYADRMPVLASLLNSPFLSFHFSYLMLTLTCRCNMQDRSRVSRHCPQGSLRLNWALSRAG